MSLTTIFGLIAIAPVILLVGLQLFMRARAGAMKGRSVPALPGAVGQRVSQAGHALLYFFSPGCAACKRLTPRVRELEKHNPAVAALDVTQHLDVARALQVMATPSTVEIQDGVIVGYHLGGLPEEVLARFA